MKLNQKERNYLQRLKKSERQFRKMRFLILGLGLAMVGMVVYLKNLLLSIPEKFEGSIEFQALIYSIALPQFYFFCVITGFFIGYTVKNWIGDPTRTLVIGLAERLETDSEPDD